MTETDYQKQLKRLMEDPRSDPDSDWHEQWLIDVQELEDEREANHD